MLAPLVPSCRSTRWRVYRKRKPSPRCVPICKSPGTGPWHSFDSAPAERAILDRVVERFASGSLSPAPRVLLSEARQAHDTSTDDLRGKVVLRP